jgi:sugar phosphate isomerase/epimerase
LVFPRIGVSLDDLRQPLKEAIHTAARLGFDAVELNARGEIRPETLSETGIRQLRKMLSDVGLKVCAVEFSTRRGYNVLPDLDRRVEATKAALKFAFALGARVVVNSVGRIPDDPSGEEWNVLCAALTDIGRYGQKCGAILAGRTGAQPGEALRRLIDALPEGCLGVTYDPGLLVVNDFSATDALRLLRRDILHVHARDGVRDLSLGRGLEVALGQGTVDFPTILATLERADYLGYVSVVRRDSKHPVSETGNALKYLRALAAG